MWALLDGPVWALGLLAYAERMAGPSVHVFISQTLVTVH